MKSIRMEIEPGGMPYHRFEYVSVSEEVLRFQAKTSGLASCS